MGGYSGCSRRVAVGWPVALQAGSTLLRKLCGKKIFIREALELILHYHTRRYAQTKRLMSVPQPRVNRADSRMTEPVVEIRDLHFARGERMIFDGIDLDIEPGGVTAIMGPSGTGKTTLLKLIGGQLRPQSGSIRVFGEEVTKLGRQGLFELRKKMGMLKRNMCIFIPMNYQYWTSNFCCCWKRHVL